MNMIYILPPRDFPLHMKILHVLIKNKHKPTEILMKLEMMSIVNIIIMGIWFSNKFKDTIDLNYTQLKVQLQSL